MKRKRRNTWYYVNRLKRLGYDMNNIITKSFMEDIKEEKGTETLFRYRYAKYITNPDSFCKT